MPGSLPGDPPHRRPGGLVLRPPYLGLVPDRCLRGRDLRGNLARVTDRLDHPCLRCRGRCCGWPHRVRGHVAGTRLSRRESCATPRRHRGAAGDDARRMPGRSDPEAVSRQGLRQGVVAGALTGGVAALLITTLILGTMVILHRQFPARTTEGYFSVTVFGPLIGMLIGSIAGWSADAIHRPTPQPEGPPGVLSAD